MRPNAVKTASHNHKMGNIQRTSYHFSFVNVMLPVDASFDIVHSAMGDIKVPRSRHALNMLSALHRLFCRYILPGKFGVQFFDKIYHPGARFLLFASGWPFEMTENGSRLTRK